MLYFKSAVAKIIFVCVDDTDSKTPETGLTFAAGELQFSKNGATSFSNIGGSAAEISDGAYVLTSSTGDTDTEGPLTLKIEKTGVRTTIMVIGQVVPWDPYAAQNGLLDVNIEQIDGGAVPAPAVTGIPDVNVTYLNDNAIALNDLRGSIRGGIAQAFGASTVTLDTGASQLDESYAGDKVEIWTETEGQLDRAQTRTIVSYVGSTRVAEVDRPWASTTGTGNKNFIVWPGGGSVDVVSWGGGVNGGGGTVATPGNGTKKPLLP